MRRREFIAGLGSAAASLPSLPLAVRAEQPALPVIGLLSSLPFETLSEGLAAFRRGLAETGHVVGQNVVFEYRSAAPAFATLVEHYAGAILVGVGSAVRARRDQILSHAARFALPTMFYDSSDARAGALLSYGPNILDEYRKVGIYAGRILKGEKPADLPVQQPTKFELVINLKTAKALGLEIPPTVLARADEVIE
jgi:putative ABC transport system substrate-binding protein